ncbi:hypothetical protein M9458_041820 [Cirrhinus mrigala]|uniref:Gypsy retrotransposon integrase-like protein 1 n=1 Tax=Cirrhinus mrigala TaxID=683832 RepID=A0ABD0NKA5_CIRMR
MPAPTIGLPSRLDTSCLPRLASGYRCDFACPPCVSRCVVIVLSIKRLQMDPQASESSQKTSPPQDPAAVFQLAHELSRQGSLVATHQQQLEKLTSLTEELVRSVQALTLITTTQAQGPSTPAAPAGVAPAPPTPVPAINSRVALPEKYDGAPGKCKGFLLQCTIYIHQQPQFYTTDDSKVSLICSLLTGRALDWATAMWEGNRMTFPSYAHFLTQFREVFEHAAGGRDPGEELTSLRQGSSTAADYTLTFRTLAAQTGWDLAPLKVLYRQGLNRELQSELACKDEGLTLSQYMELAIKTDNLMRSRRGYRSTRFTSPSPVTTESEPMQIGATGLTPEERDRRVRNHLCLYCGQAGHLRTNCPIRPHRPDTARVSSDSLSDTFELEVILICNHQTTQTVALIDSGAAGNFIDISFAKSACVPLIACNDVAVTALDGRALGSGKVEAVSKELELQVSFLHSERLRLFAITSPSHPIILGLPWLRQHNPNISWTHPQILHWSPECHAQCLQRVVRRPRAAPFRQTDLSSTTLLPSCYRDLLEAFSEEKASHLPPHRPYDCSIELQPGAMPTRGRVFPLSQPETEAMERYISEELAKGFIRPSTSPASAGFFFVKKKDGSLRPCIDYRSLNEVTIKYRYPLPLVPAALEQLRTAKYFTKLDLRSAYNLIRIKAGDEWKTAFSTTNGHYEYLVMPFGLSNSPSVFQAFVNEIFRDMLHRHLIVYIDDILIYSENLETHIQQVRAVLQRLIKHQLYAKLPKCEFHQTKIAFLGYIISQDGVAMDEKKVSSVVSWPRPRTVKELQRFLGFANFYRRFIRGFSQIAAPLTSMIQGGTRTLKWTSESEQAFKELKEHFTTSPILRHPNPELEFIVEVDASNSGVGAVLSQRHGEPPKMFPCAFFSRKLSAAERNYDVGDRELLALKEALLEWRHWLEGSKVPFLVLTDHRNLEYIRSAKRLNSRQARWSLFFARFEFRITYRPGSKNNKADALSRIHDAQQQELTPDPIIPPSLLLAPVRWDIMTEIREAQVTEPPPPNCPQDREYVPETLRTRLLHWIHDSPGAGHPGITATLELTKNRFWWPALTQDIVRFVTQCRTCNIAKSSHQRPAGLLQPLPVPHRPWSHIAIDFVTDLPLSQNYTTILTVVDRFSKACRIIPLTKLPTAWETAEVMVHQVFRVFGIPEDIVSDRGPQFTSRVWHAFCKQLNINVSLTSGYHPQSNGQVERLNQELTRFLRTYCHTNQSDWSKYVVWAEYAQNSLRKPATGLTPFKCILGYQPPLFPWTGEPSNLPAVDHWLSRSEDTWDAAHVHLQQAVRRTTTQADRRRRANPAYQPGQWVWLSSRDLRLHLPSKKLSPRYVGPFKIIKQITPVSFRLELPTNYRISPTFHVSLLKPAGAPDGERDQDEAAETETPPLIIDGEEAYRVHEILDSRRRGRVMQYLVDWEGYGPEERSWVNAQDILDPSLIEDFHQRNPGRPAPRPRGRPRRRQGPRLGSCSQEGGSVMNRASVALPGRHQREPSPEY